jgi:hypothetical protein
MDSSSLSDTEKAIVGQALRAAADGPLFPDWEFQALFGLERTTVRTIADGWPELRRPSEEVARAVNNALNNLLGYPHGKDVVWSRWISVDRRKIRELLDRLQGCGCNIRGSRPA